MTLPMVALVGRPNVGKSTLFNRLVGEPLAIVHDSPGVTRDRHYADADIFGREVTLIDTGGFDPESDDPMRQGIARHVRAAIAEADVIVFVVDATLPPTAADRESVDLLRRSGKPFLTVANKADSEALAAGAAEHYSLGVDDLLALSALHGRGTAELGRTIAGLLPPPTEEPAVEPDETVARVALIGRPNAGKSSLFNRLAGEERSLVDSRPGTTRDPVDSRIHFAGKDYLVVDTAGIRRRPRVDEGIEAISVMRAIRAIDRAEVVVLMCDGSGTVSEQDQRLLALAADRGRAVVVGLNKADLLDGPARKRALEQAADALVFARWAPVVLLSAQSGNGVRDLMKAVWRAAAEYKRRVPTGELNRFFERVVEKNPPPTQGGRAPRIYFVTQASTAPPVFVAMCNHAASIRESYRRFIKAQIHEAFGFESVPVIVRWRERGRRDLSEK